MDTCREMQGTEIKAAGAGADGERGCPQESDALPKRSRGHLGQVGGQASSKCSNLFAWCCQVLLVAPAVALNQPC